MAPYDGFGAYFEDPTTYTELGQLAPEPDDYDTDYPNWNESDEPDGPQGGEHRIDCEMREEREDR